MKKRSYILDSFAVLAYFQAEPSGPKVKDLLSRAKAGESVLFLSVINLGEVIYTVGQKLGDEIADEILHDILNLPIKLAEATMDRVLAAARIKAQYAVSYADVFAIALAQELDAPVLTGDPEFKKVESFISLVWL